MSEIMALASNKLAEWSVLSSLLLEPSKIGEVVGLPLEMHDFSTQEARIIYQEMIDRHFAGHTIDAIVVADALREKLAEYFGLADNLQVTEVLAGRLHEAQSLGGDLIEHARIVRRDSVARQIQRVTAQALGDISANDMEPEAIGDKLSAELVRISAGMQRRSELLSWLDTGREYVRRLQQIKAAHEAGMEIGVYTGLQCMDEYTAGIGPGELCFIAGEPGVGKTALAWAAGLGFAEKQMRKPLPPNARRVHTLYLSMEMNLYGSTARIVSTLTGIDGTMLRRGRISDQQYRNVVREWKMRENLPIIFNFASNFRVSQMRALIAQAIQRHNVGFVIIDHFRMIDTDRHYNNPIHADEVKVRFLKENVCKDLDVAVMCLAHSTKVGREEGKPRLSDLRGSGMISAFADFVGFVWSEARQMDQETRTLALRSTNDMDLSWEKNRWGHPGSAGFTFEQNTMKVLERDVSMP